MQAAVALRADADLRAARLVDSTVAQFAAVAGSTVVARLMAEVGSTVVEADMAADTGKFVRGLM